MIQHPIFITFIIYFLIILGIGVYAIRFNRSMGDFVLGGRSLNSAIAALGAGASDMSGWLLLGVPGAVYAFGLSQVWLPIGVTLGAWFNWQLVAKRLRVYTEVANDSLTIPAFFDNRFHDHSGILRMVCAGAILVFFTIYAAAGFVSGALLFENVFHFDYHHALFLGAAIMITYTSIGGFLAVNWTDFFQGSLMLLALLVVPFTAMFHLGGWQESLSIIQQQGNQLLDVFSNTTPIAIISLLAWGLGYCGQPHILVRFMAVKQASDIPKAQLICMSWMVLSLYGAILTGFIGIAFYANSPLTTPEEIFLALTQSLFNPWVAGILMAAVLSAIMSTIAAQLLASSSALAEDFYHNFFRPQAKERELVFVSRLTVVGVAVTAILLAYNPHNSVLTLVSYAWAGLGASFGPVILCALYWKRTTRNGAIAGIITGGITVIVWKHLQVFGGIFELYEIAPGFVLSLIATLAISKFDTSPSDAVLQDFEKASQCLIQQ